MDTVVAQFEGLRYSNLNTEKIQGWFGAIEHKEGPSAACRAYVSLVEFAVPKMPRNELMKVRAGPVFPNP